MNNHTFDMNETNNDANSIVLDDTTLKALDALCKIDNKSRSEGMQALLNNQTCFELAFIEDDLNELIESLEQYRLVLLDALMVSGSGTGPWIRGWASGECDIYLDMNDCENIEDLSKLFELKPYLGVILHSSPSQELGIEAWIRQQYLQMFVRD